METDNKLDFIPGESVFPWNLHSLGEVLNTSSKTKQALSARCAFTVRRAFDALDSTDYGRVVEGSSDLGISLKAGSYAFNVSATNLAFRAGRDLPTKAQVVVNDALAGLKFTFATEYQDDSYLAVSYDAKQKKPELSVCWAGQTLRERASLAFTADPLHRSLKVGAAIAFPGPEWRDAVFDEDKDVVQEPSDDGGRHRVWLQHELRSNDLLHKTRVGARIDVGRALNYLADFVDYNLQQHVPSVVWKLPLSTALYGLLVPDADEEQVRFHLRGWDFDVSHDFDRAKPALALARRLGSTSRLAVGYDLDSQAVGLELCLRGGLKAEARLDRHRNPSFNVMIEPLSLLR